jgi:hypothetical protein
MKISKEELRERVQFWAQPNQRASWFSTDELIEIAYEAAENIKNHGIVKNMPGHESKFIRAFDFLIYAKSITEGKFPK